MSNFEEYKELMAFHPGYYVAEIIEDMGISQKEFALRLGTTPKTISTLVNGQISLSNVLAKKLSVMLGTSVDVWLNIQKEYDEKIICIKKEKDFDTQKKIASGIDYKYFEEVAGLVHTNNINDKIKNLCKYFVISDLNVLLEPDFLINYRVGIPNIEKKNIINSRAWIQTAINLSKKIKVNSFNAEKLKSYLPELRSMTTKDPKIFLPRMENIFAECGVAFIILPYLKNSGINGAVKWINSNQVVLAMNNRGLTADKFWFSLFHEIKHVLQQKLKITFISYDRSYITELDSKLEEEADLFARNYLIPPNEYKKLKKSMYISDDEISEFAKLIGIHPGIVVGRLQHDKIISHNRGTKLKTNYYIDNNI